MANIRHSQLTGADLHEVKGIAEAEKGMVYYADGTGTGEWAPTTRCLFISTKNNVTLPKKTATTIIPASAYNAPVTATNIQWNGDRVVVQHPGLYRISTGWKAPLVEFDSETGVVITVGGFYLTCNGSVIDRTQCGWGFVSVVELEAGDIIAPVYSDQLMSTMWSGSPGLFTYDLRPTYLEIEGIGG